MTLRILALALGAMLSLVACGKKAAVSGSRGPVPVGAETTRITEPLHADGTPDYVAAVNARYSAGVTPENNGYVLVLKALGTQVIKPEVREKFLKLVGMPESDKEQAIWEDYSPYLARAMTNAKPEDLYDASDDLYKAGAQVWDRAKYPVVAAYLDKREPELELFAAAMKLEHFWIPLVPADDRTLASTIRAGDLESGIRQMSIATLARATLRMGAGDFPSFLEDVLAVKRAVRKLEPGPMLVEMLVADSLETKVNETIGAVVGSGKLTVEECRSLRESLEKLGPIPAMGREVLEVERYLALDNAMLVATGDTERMKALNAPEAWLQIDRERADWNLVLIRLNESFDELLKGARESTLSELVVKHDQGADAALKTFGPALGAILTGEKPPPIQLPAVETAPGETREQYSARVAQSLMDLVEATGAYYSVELMHRECQLKESLLMPLIAAAETKARTGSWPARLEDLPAEDRAAIPPDGYATDGSPVRYRADANGARIYSIGRNGIDDGGILDRSKKLDDIVLGANEK